MPDLAEFVAAVGEHDPVTIAGLSTRGGAVAGVRCVAAPSGIDWIQADEMTLSCGAGTPVDVVSDALAAVGQRLALPAGGTVGGALAAGVSGVRRLADGPVRDTLLQARYVSAAGVEVKAGGPTVKNVSGFDLCRLLVGSRGTLGFLGEVIVRTRPLPLMSQWFTTPSSTPLEVFRALYRPTAVLWDGELVWVLLEGHPVDIAAAAQAQHLVAVDAPPIVPTAARRLLAPAEAAVVTASLAPGTFISEVGLGIVHCADASVLPPPDADPAPLLALRDRTKHLFDPTGRLNPGVVVG